jgi:heptosyltransferase-1
MLKRVLIVKPSSLGDIVHAFPLVSSIKSFDPSIQVDWVVNSEFRDFVGRNESVERVLSFPRSSWGKEGFWTRFFSFAKELRKTRYDAVLDAQGLFRSGFLSRLSHAARVIGFEDAREGGEFFYMERVAVPAPIHAVRKNLLLLEPLGIPEKFTEPSFRYEPSDHIRLDAILGQSGIEPGEPFILVHPGAKRTIKMWPSLYFSELIRKLKNVRKEKVVLLGGKSDGPLLDEIRTRAGTQNPILPGTVPIDFLPLLMKKAVLYIGNDSGPLHIAVMSKTPTISFYGSSDPARTGPFGPSEINHILSDPVECSPCGDFKKFCSHQTCMVGVTPERVLETIRTLEDHVH